MVLTEWLPWRKPLEVMISAALVCTGCGDSGQGSGGSGGARNCARTSSCDGDIAVKLDVNRCPDLVFLWVAPSRAEVGKSVHFGAVLSDPDPGDSVDQFWTATGARLRAEGSSGEVDTFTCLLPGTQTLTLWYSDSRGCTRNQATEIECVATDDAGG